MNESWTPEVKELTLVSGLVLPEKGSLHLQVRVSVADSQGVRRVALYSRPAEGSLEVLVLREALERDVAVGRRDHRARSDHDVLPARQGDCARGSGVDKPADHERPTACWSLLCSTGVHSTATCRIGAWPADTGNGCLAPPPPPPLVLSGTYGRMVVSTIWR